MFETWHIGFYVSAIGSWRMSFAEPLRWSSYRKILYKIPSWTDAPISNIPIKVQIQRYRCSKLDILFFMFRQSALEEWVLPILNVWPHSLWKYTIFQVGLTILLAIFLSEYKYKDTDVWNLIHCFFMFRQLAHKKWVLPSHYVGAHTVKNYIKFQVGLTLHLAIFPLKSKYKDTDVWNLTYCFLCFGNRLLKNEFCQVLMLDLIVYDNILYFKLDWRAN